MRTRHTPGEDTTGKSRGHAAQCPRCRDKVRRWGHADADEFTSLSSANRHKSLGGCPRRQPSDASSHLYHLTSSYFLLSSYVVRFGSPGPANSSSSWARPTTGFWDLHQGRPRASKSGRRTTIRGICWFFFSVRSGARNNVHGLSAFTSTILALLPP